MKTESSPTALAKKKITLDDIKSLPALPKVEHWAEKLYLMNILRAYEKAFEKGKVKKDALEEVTFRIYVAIS